MRRQDLDLPQRRHPQLHARASDLRAGDLLLHHPALFAERLEEDVAFGRALDLARLVQEIAHRGENELRGCQAILRGFAEYLRSRPEPVGELEAM